VSQRVLSLSPSSHVHAGALRFVGGFSSSLRATYQRGDVVTWVGNAYVRNANPVSGIGFALAMWDLLAQGGTTGPKGDTGPPGADGQDGRYPVVAALTSTITATDTAAYAGDVPSGGLTINPGTPTDPTRVQRLWVRFTQRADSGAVRINLPQPLPTEFVPTTGYWATHTLHAVWVADRWVVLHLSGGVRLEHWMAPYDGLLRIPLLVVAGASGAERDAAVAGVVGWSTGTRRAALADAGVQVQVTVPSVGDITTTPAGRLVSGLSGVASYQAGSKRVLLSTSATQGQANAALDAAATAVGV
jgi:hypothetical protein